MLSLFTHAPTRRAKDGAPRYNHDLLNLAKPFRDCTDSDGRTGRIMVFSSIDNLWKGAASQAVQNLDLMFGRDEREGLT